MKKSICVFCSSRDEIEDKYHKIANELGKLIAQRNYKLIHGAGSIGLMGSLMKSCANNKGEIIGVVPQKLNKPNIVSSKHQTLIVTQDMMTRKEYMRNNSDAFISLAGGFGTLEELAETICLKQLKYHNKAIVIINSFGFYDNLLNFFEDIYTKNFADESYRELYKVTKDINEALEYIENYKIQDIYDKYLND